jgi:hypothetical protein
MMGDRPQPVVNKDIRYGFLNLIDADRASAEVEEEWFFRHAIA